MKEKQATEVKAPNIFIGIKSHMSVGVRIDINTLVTVMNAAKIDFLA